MGNCLQASETDDVDLLHSDNEAVNVSGRGSVVTSNSGNVGHRSRSQSSETSVSNRPTRSRRANRIGQDGEQSRQRRSSDATLRQRSVVLPPPYEIASVQRYPAPVSDAGSSTPVPIYHPSPGVSRQASELTEEEQIKIAQRIGLIQHLPIDIYVEGNKSDTECIICMADFIDGDRVRFLPCMHTYHVDCIDEWLMRSFSCPSCLEPVDSALLTSYDQQQLAAFAEFGLGNGNDVDGLPCHSLPRQLEQLTAITSPPPSSPPVTNNSNIM